MRTSLAKLNRVENFLTGNISPEDKTLIEAELIINKELSGEVLAQQHAYRIVTAYARQSLKLELEILHRKLQHDSNFVSFWNSVQKIFQTN